MKPLDLFFSGVNSPVTFDLLHQAGIRHILVDPRDLKNVPQDWDGHLALDCGAYRAWKTGQPVDVPAYVRLAVSRRFAFTLAADVMGDPAATLQNWLEHCRGVPGMLPVWGWGSSSDLLKQYLDESERVAIGGLVPLIRDRRDERLTPPDRKAWDKERQKVLDQLLELCTLYPNQFHLLGLCWLKAIRELRGVAASADTSKFLDAARYRMVVYIHARTGNLQQAPAGVLKVADLSQDELCVMSARAMNGYCNLSQRGELPIT